MLRALLLVQLKSQSAKLWALVIYGVALPGLLFTLSSHVQANGMHETNALAGVLVYSSVFVVFRAMTQSLLNDRLGGTIALLRSCGVERSHYLGARIIEGYVLSILPCIGTFAISYVVGQPFHISLVGIGAYAMWGSVLSCLAIVLCSFFPSLIGYQVANLFAIALCTISPLFYTMDRVPALLAPVVEILPSTMLVNVLCDRPGGSVFGLIAWMGALLPVSFALFQWREE